MNTIPISKEFIHQFQDKFRENDGGVVNQLMVAFAKLHVEAALEAAAENAKSIDEGSVNRHGDWSEYYVVDKESILSAYPLTNIK